MSRLVKEYLHVDKHSIFEMQQEGDLKGLDGLDLTDVEADHLISALYEVEFLVDVDTEEIVSVNGKDLLNVPTRAQWLTESVRELLDFIADKYDVEKIEDFTCSHHRKLAGMIGWRR